MYLLLKVFNMTRNIIFIDIIKRNFLKIFQLLSSKKMRLFYRYSKRNEFIKAIEVGRTLIHKEKNNPEFLKEYGLCFIYSGQIEEGKSLIINALKAIKNCDYQKTLNYSKRTLQPSQIKQTTYTYLGGHANYGFIKNDLTSKDETQKSLISKITWYHSNQVNHENYYYLEICKNHPELFLFSPPIHDYQKIPNSNIELLTTEYIEHEKTTNAKLDEVIKINRIIESITYREAIEMLKGIEVKKGRYVPRFLHQKTINQEAIREMKIRVNKIEGGEILECLLNRLDEVIIGKKLYKKIRPEIHYSFCHNDFHSSNILVQKKSEKHFIIDWDNYGIAMRGWDMSFYFGNFKYTFHEIKEVYISRITFERSIDEKIAKIYFVFLQIYRWALRLNGNNCNNKLVTHFTPAIEFIEEIGSDL
ncbi:hypothetical protein SANA_01560 [Gottschalkiaceae bacterium SANA]|nr:hypothetical protein SANA_01560 [Gottschalkiaceae bacterium SANA]